MSKKFVIKRKKRRLDKKVYEVIKTNPFAWNQNRFKYIDIILSSGEIKKIFFKRCLQLGMDPMILCNRVGIPYTTFKHRYIFSDDPMCSADFDQERFIKMLEFVGIDIKILAKVKPLEETYVKLKELGLLRVNIKRVIPEPKKEEIEDYFEETDEEEFTDLL